MFPFSNPNKQYYVPFSFLYILPLYSYNLHHICIWTIDSIPTLIGLFYVHSQQCILSILIYHITLFFFFFFLIDYCFDIFNLYITFYRLRNCVGWYRYSRKHSNLILRSVVESIIVETNKSVGFIREGFGWIVCDSSEFPISAN